MHYIGSLMLLHLVKSYLLRTKFQFFLHERFILNLRTGGALVKTNHLLNQLTSMYIYFVTNHVCICILHTYKTSLF